MSDITAPHPASGTNDDESTDDEHAGLPAMVVDLGKIKRQAVKQLKKGEGPILRDVDEIVDTVREELGEELGSREILPIIVLYEKRPKKNDNWLD